METGMGRREMRSRRKEEMEKNKLLEELIRAANAQVDAMSSFPALRCFQTENGDFVEVQSGTGNRLSTPMKQILRSLTKMNMERVFGHEWPSEEKVKNRDMVSPEARYIFLRLPESNEVDGLLGFLHYRFTLEEHLPVLYIYELQIRSEFQGTGLGSFLMELGELIARQHHMKAVLLTVQKANVAAFSFYINKLK